MFQYAKLIGSNSISAKMSIERGSAFNEAGASLPDWLAHAKSDAITSTEWDLLIKDISDRVQIEIENQKIKEEFSELDEKAQEALVNDIYLKFFQSSHKSFTVFFLFLT